MTSTNDTPPPSVDAASADPTTPQKPIVRRLNQRAIMVLLLFLGIALWVVLMAVARKPAAGNAAETPLQPQSPGVTSDMIASFFAESARKQAEMERGMANMRAGLAPDGSSLPTAPPAQTNVPFPSPPPQGWSYEAQSDPPPFGADPYADSAASGPQAAAQDSPAAIRARALASPLAPPSFAAPASPSPASDGPGGYPSLQLPAVPPPSFGGEATASPSPTETREAWLAGRTAPGAAATPVLQRPATGAQLRAGTVIPAVLRTALSSELPGTVVASVRRPVYDERGEALLIPQGSQLLGQYDSRVVYGQRRILMAWTRVVLPDGSAVNFDATAADAAGRAGLRDKTNNHFVRLFGSALLLSAVGAGAQLSQPDSGIANSLTPAQIASAAVGQEMARITSAVVNRELDVAPTIEIRPGTLFNVSITNDIRWPRIWTRRPLMVSTR